MQKEHDSKLKAIYYPHFIDKTIQNSQILYHLSYLNLLRIQKLTHQHLIKKMILTINNKFIYLLNKFNNNKN